jgi:adenylate kinase
LVPTASGKGTQGAVVQKIITLLMLSLELFSGKTLRAEQSLAKKQRSILTEEILVPDSITIPMILDRLKKG